MRLRLAVVIALGLLVPPLLPVDSIAASRKSCRVAGSTTLAQNSLVRLYSMPNPEGRDLRACLRSNGRHRRLDADSSDDLVTSRSWNDPRLAGRYAAWTHTFTDVSCKAACPPGYSGVNRSTQVVDVRRGRVVTSHPWPREPGSVVLTNRGAIAWIQEASPLGFELLAVPPGGDVKTIDKGNLERSSLRAYYSIVTYTKDGARLWALP